MVSTKRKVLIAVVFILIIAIIIVVRAIKRKEEENKKIAAANAADVSAAQAANDAAWTVGQTAGSVVGFVFLGAFILVLAVLFKKYVWPSIQAWRGKRKASRNQEEQEDEVDQEPANGEEDAKRNSTKRTSSSPPMTLKTMLLNRFHQNIDRFLSKTEFDDWVTAFKTEGKDNAKLSDLFKNRIKSFPSLEKEFEDHADLPKKIDKLADDLAGLDFDKAKEMIVKMLDEFVVKEKTAPGADAADENNASAATEEANEEEGREGATKKGMVAT